MDNSVENMEIRLLEREKWRGFVLDMDYVACERYETRVSDGKDGYYWAYNSNVAVTCTENA